MVEGLKAIISPDNLLLLATFMLLQATPAGWLIDILGLGMLLIAAGGAVLDLGSALWNVCHARNKYQFRRASMALADALAETGLFAVNCLVGKAVHTAGKRISAGLEPTPPSTGVSGPGSLVTGDTIADNTVLPLPEPATADTLHGTELIPLPRPVAVPPPPTPAVLPPSPVPGLTAPAWGKACVNKLIELHPEIPPDRQAAMQNVQFHFVTPKLMNDYHVWYTKGTPVTPGCHGMRFGAYGNIPERILVTRTTPHLILHEATHTAQNPEVKNFFGQPMNEAITDAYATQVTEPRGWVEPSAYSTNGNVGAVRMLDSILASNGGGGLLGQAYFGEGVEPLITLEDAVNNATAPGVFGDVQRLINTDQGYAAQARLFPYLDVLPATPIEPPIVSVPETAAFPVDTSPPISGSPVTGGTWRFPGSKVGVLGGVGVVVAGGTLGFILLNQSNNTATPASSLTASATAPPSAQSAGAAQNPSQRPLTTVPIRIADNQDRFLADPCGRGPLRLRWTIRGAASGAPVVVRMSGPRLPAQITFTIGADGSFGQDFHVGGNGIYTTTVVSIGGQSAPSANSENHATVSGCP
jgi:hypothetical protein